MADTQDTKTKRQTVLDRLAAKYPDKSYDDDEALMGQIDDDYADYEERIGKYQDTEKKLSDMMSADPRSASLLIDMKDGKDPALGLMRRFGDELRDILDDPERQEELAEQQAAYLEQVAKEKELEEEWKKNITASCQALEEYQQEKGLSDEETDALMQQVIDAMHELVVGKFSKDLLEKFDKASNYDAAVETARGEGEVKGRNARIEEKLRKADQGDGTPVLDGKNGRGGGDRMPSLGALDGYAGQNKTIWERGGARRVKR